MCELEAEAAAYAVTEDFAPSETFHSPFLSYQPKQVLETNEVVMKENHLIFSL